MTGTFSRSLRLARACVALLRSDKSLLMFPLASSICCLLVAASFLIPVIAAIMAADGIAEHGHRMTAGGYVLTFLFYLTQYFVIIFFNTALAGAALARLRGEETSFGEGMAIARSNLVSIFGYALIAATVGTVLRALHERLGLIGRLAVDLLGLAWTVATFLVVPVLASQDVGPVEAISRSMELLKCTWGENITGNAGLGVAFFLLTLLAILVSALLVGGAYATHSMAAIVAAIAIVVVGLTILGLIQATLQGIYAVVLYRYAEDGEAGQGFDQVMLDDAFKPKEQEWKNPREY
nr:DUF6159 family protein [Dyella sp. ASV24]